MDGMEEAKKYTSISENSAGTASDKYTNAYLQSVEASQERLKASWEEFSTTIWNSDLIKGTFDVGSGLLGWLTKTVDLFGTLPTLSTAAVGALSVFGNKGFINTIDGANGKTIAPSLFGLIDKRKSTDAGIFKDISKQLNSKQNFADVFAKSFDKLSPSAQEAGKSIAETYRIAVESGTSAENAATAASAAFNKQAIATTKAATEMGVLRLKTIAMNAVLNMGIMVVINAAIAGIGWLIKRQEELRKSALESAQAFTDMSSSIDDYKSQIKTLKTELASGNLTEQEAYDKRAQLIQIQRELKDSYGKELEGIDLVNGGLNEQLDLLDQVSVKQAAEDLRVNAEANAKAAKEMEEVKTYNIGLNISEGWEGSDALKNLSDQFKDAGINIDENGDGTFNIQLKANAKDAEKTLADFTYELNNLELRDVFESGMGYLASSIEDNKKILADYQKSYDNKNFQRIISEDTKYNGKTGTEHWKDVTKAVEEYNEALASGDEEVQSKALSNLASVKAEVMKAFKDDVGKSDFFESLLSDYDVVLAQHEFKLNFDADVSGIKTKITTALSGLQGLTDQDLKNPGADWSLEQKRSYAVLQTAARESEMDVNHLIDLLSDLELIPAGIANEIVKAETTTSTSLHALQLLVGDVTAECEAKLEKLGAAISKALDFRASRNEVQAALNQIKELTGIEIDIDSKSMISELKTIKAFIDGDIVAFQDFAQEALKSLGVKPDTSGIKNFMEQLITLAANATTQVGMLASSLLGLYELNGVVASQSKLETSRDYSRAGGKYVGNQREKAKYYDYAINTNGLQAYIDKMNSATSKSGGGGSSTDPWEEAFNKEYALIQYQRSMELISEQTYYDKLTALNNKYFSNRAEYIEQDRKNLQELFELQKSIGADRVNDMEHALFLDEQNGASENSQIRSMKAIQEQLHKMAEEGRKRGLSDNDSYIQELQKQWWDYQNRIEDLEKSRLDRVKASYEDAKSNIQTLIDLTVDLIKQEKEDQIDALDKQKEKYAEIINAKKESLRLTEAELSYQEQVDEYTTDISKMQAEADLLAKDGSREAMAKRAKLLEEIAAKNKELNNFQHQDSIEKAEEALDKQLESFEKEKDDEIKVIRDYLSKSGQLVKDAMDRIDKDGDKLFKDLMEWNRTYGDNLDSTIQEAWNNGTSALKRYKAELGTISTSDTVNGINNTIDSINKGQNSSNTIRTRQEIIDEMKANSAAWHNASTSQKSALAAKNQRLGYDELSNYYPNIYYDSNTGKWYEDKNKKMAIFHNGFGAGVVGGTRTLKSDELFALLKKKEVVANEDDISLMVSKIKRGNSAISAMDGLLSQFKQFAKNSLLDSFPSKSGGIQLEVHPSPVYIYGNADQSAIDSLRDRDKSFANDVVEMFVKRGLKPG